MQTVKSIPLFGIVLVIYMAIGAIFFMGGSTDVGSEAFDVALGGVMLPSGIFWVIQIKDVIILGGLFCLFIEIIKSTRSTDAQIVEHILSTFVFISYMVAFLWAPIAGNSTFFALLVMSLIDVIAGFTITISAARRDFSMG